MHGEPKRAPSRRTASAQMLHCGHFVGKSFGFFIHMVGMQEPTAALTPLHPPAGLAYDRTHMFVAAVLVAAASSGPVQIRNMSRGGALIEGAALPELGAGVTLKRECLEMAAIIIWRSGRKAGLAFEGQVEVADWMARNQPSREARRRLNHSSKWMRFMELQEAPPTFGTMCSSGSRNLVWTRCWSELHRVRQC
jgi:hypothetical protein